MLLIGKLLIATAVVAGPVAGVFAFTSLGSNSSTTISQSSDQGSPSSRPESHSPKSKTETSEKDKYTKGNCYVIESASNDKEKLLTCTGMLHNYFFHSTEQKDIFKKVISIKIDKDGNQLLIVIEGESKQNQTLKVQGEDWKKFPQKEINLVNNQNIHCALSGTWSQNDQVSWSCAVSSPTYTSYQLSKLTLFK